MNNSSYNTSKHLSGSGDRISSSAPPSPSVEVEARDAKISSFKMFRVRMASLYSSLSTELHKAQYQDTTAADVNDSSLEGSDMGMQMFLIPTKSASCTSGPALIDDGEEVSLAPTTLTESKASTANVGSKQGGSDMGIEIFHVPTKSENCKPGPILNPRSCASGLDLYALVESINDVQQSNNNHGRNSSVQNEDWDWDDLRSPQGNLFLEGNDDN